MSAVSDSHTVIWVPRYWPAVGGTEFHSHELAQHLSRDHQVSVLAHCTATESLNQPLAVAAADMQASESFDGTVRTVTLEPSAIYVKLLRFFGWRHSRNRIARKMYQFCFNSAFRKTAKHYVENADRVHFIYNGLTEAACLAADICSELKIPFVITPNVLDTSGSGSSWDSEVFRWLYQRADEVIALTTHEAQWLLEHGVSADKITVVPYGPILHPRNEQCERGPVQEILSSRYILFLGRLVPEKGYRLLLEAFEAYSDTTNDIQLVLVGPAEDFTSSVIDDTNQRLQQKRIHLLQDVPQPLKTALLEESTLLCVPSKRESLGGVYIEAMACGKPVIALDRPVSRCVINHKKEGLLVANDKDALVDALRTILDNAKMADDMGCAGKTKVAFEFSWHVVTEKMLAVYSDDDAVNAIENTKAA